MWFDPSKHGPFATRQVADDLEPDGDPAEEASSGAGARCDDGAACPERATGLEAERARLVAAEAELEGARRRVERDAERAKQAARSSLLDELLPVLDGLDRAMAATDGRPGLPVPNDALLAGVRMVRERLEQALLRYGAERIETVGQPFDPREHEAVGLEPARLPNEDGRVVREWRAGYRFGDRVLRAAQVLVGKWSPTLKQW